MVGAKEPSRRRRARGWLCRFGYHPETIRFGVIAPPRLTPGTQVIREWGNERHQVTVEVAGFIYRGQRYRSLSEIARRITGTRWSGPLFFGVTPSLKGRGRALKGRLSV